MNAADVAELLEVVAAERLVLLRPLVKVLEYSRAAGGFADLAGHWGVGPDSAADLFEVAATTSHALDSLERSRSSWTHPSEVVNGANVAALQSFAHGRRDRIRETIRADARRAARLDLIVRKLDRAVESERRRRAVEKFLGERRRPVDPEWLRAFLERPR